MGFNLVSIFIFYIKGRWSYKYSRKVIRMLSTWWLISNIYRISITFHIIRAGHEDKIKRTIYWIHFAHFLIVHNNNNVHMCWVFVMRKDKTVVRFSLWDDLKGFSLLKRLSWVKVLEWNICVSFNFMIKRHFEAGWRRVRIRERENIKKISIKKRNK